VLLDHGILTTTVRDGGAADTTAAEQTDDPLRVHGRALHLVDALATRWGSALDTIGTTVWFVLEPRNHPRNTGPFACHKPVTAPTPTHTRDDPATAGPAGPDSTR
jgi:hypothetical protein